MAVPFSWKVGGALALVVAAAFAWHGVSLYLGARQADELTRDVARNAELQAQRAKVEAAKRSDQLSATLRHRRQELANTYRQVNEDAAQYQLKQARREERLRQEQLRVEASYKLGSNQTCVGGLVINRHGSSFTQMIGSSGKPIGCTGGTAIEPLR